MGLRAPALAALALVLLAAGTAHAADGDVLVADFNAFGGPGGVIRVDSLTGARTTVSDGSAPGTGPSLVNPGDVALEPGGDILVVDFDALAGMGGGVIRLDAQTGARTAVSGNGAPAGGPSFADPSGMAVAANGDIVVVDRGAFADGGGGVIRVDPVTGARTRISENAAPAGAPNFVEPAGVALAPDGHILVADEEAFGGSGGLIRVDPVTGARTTISANAAPAGGPNFVQPVGIAMASGGDLFVTDEDAFAGGTGGVIRVDAATGARTAVSANGAPAGGAAFAQPYGIALAPSGAILVTDFDAFGGGGGVLRIDRLTGARTRVSANGTPPGGPAYLDPVGIALLPPRTSSAPPATPRAPARTPDLVAPVISSAAVRPSTFTARRGTVVRYRLTEPARVTFALERRSIGRRVGKRCRRPTRVNRSRARCTRFIRIGSFFHRGAAGANRRRFSGAVRGRRLRPGRYRATLRALDAALNRSRPRRLRFRVVGSRQ